VSRTLKEPTWRNLTIIRGNVIESVRALKEQSGKNILTDGSSHLVHALLARDLVDELHLLLYPLTLGNGKRLLPEGVHATFSLISSTPYPSGVVGIHYTRQRSGRLVSLSAGTSPDRMQNAMRIGVARRGDVLARGPFDDCRADSAHCLLHERTDPCLFRRGQFRQGEGSRPDGAFGEVRLVAETQRRISRLELLRALEEADAVAVPGVGGHPRPEFRRERWRR